MFAPVDQHNLRPICQCGETVEDTERRSSTAYDSDFHQPYLPVAGKREAKTFLTVVIVIDHPQNR